MRKQNWIIGGSYAIALDSYIVKERKFSKPDGENDNLVCVYSITEPGEVLICYKIDNVQLIIVDGVSADPVKTYNFEEAGEHTIEFVLIDKTLINRYMFRNCNNLTSINIPTSVEIIESDVFIKCSSLAYIKISKNNPIYDSRNNCNAIIETATNTLLIGTVNTTIIPDSITIISEKAFSGCASLTSINIPDSVTSIGKLAFSDCSLLKSIHIGNGLSSIGDRVFNNCNNITSITMDENNYFYAENNILVSKSDYSMVFVPRDLEHIIIPENVKIINSLRYMTMKTVTIHEQLERIEYQAFENCVNLESIIIPDSVTYLGDGAFSGCSALKSVTIGNGITTIGNGVFSSCDSLISITVNSSLVSIGERAFEYCSDVQYYDFTACTSIPTLSNINAFYNIEKGCEIRVPAALYNDWIATNNWSTYANYIVAV